MNYFPHLATALGEFVEGSRGERLLTLGHARPDGDCIGAQIALARLFRQQGLDVRALNYDAVPVALQFLLREDRVEALTAESLEGALLCFVDCADELRVGNEASKFVSGRDFHLNIDHHISNTEYARTNLLDARSAATCEIIAGMAFDLGWKVDALTAQALITGIMTDTGRFSYAATSSRVFELCSRLVDCGASTNVAAQSLYENEPFGRLKLLQRFLSTLRIECQGRLCLGHLFQHDFDDTGSTYEDTEGFVDYTRSVRGAKIGLYFEERRYTVKASFRSEDARYRVDRIAKRFGGGGHACAAAFSRDGRIADFEEDVVRAASEVIASVEAEEKESRQ